ncbi:g-type lectin s-receptor-like serine/threonine-protein kinase [Quercus suber]|uniref:G-type lectin s-receptor-like serine/threonine-protein kinase n=1 Tax=Quercus suber TaxID=58331 RepID=A0AAW0KCN0_QUESU
MASKERLFSPTLLLIVIIIISSLWGSSAALDTLKQGDVLNPSQYLVSAKQRFTLGFFSPTSYYGVNKNNSYLAIWYTNYTESRVVWVANRNKPISHNSSAFLTLDHLGKLMINSSGFGGDPFVIYSGGETENTSLSSSKNESLFEYIYPTKGQDYIINTDAEGQYFTYSLDTESVPPLDSSDRGRSEWQLQYWGPIMDRSTSIMKMNFCYGYGMEAEGCERWDQPKCRYYNQTFEQKSGFFKHIGPDGLPQDEAAGSVDDDNTTIGPADCRARCWNNCDCRGFNGDEGTGCQYWTGNVKFEPDDGVSRSRILKYVLTDPPKGERSK